MSAQPAKRADRSAGKDAEGPSIVWFRNDLRMGDNPALHAAVKRKRPILPVFVLENDNGLRPLGAASRWWLHHSLASLEHDLVAAGAELLLFAGSAGDLLPALATASGAGALFFNRRYGESGRELDAAITTAVEALGCEVESFNGRLLHEPWEIETKAGGSYGVYGPYARAAQAKGLPDKVLSTPKTLDGFTYEGTPASQDLQALALLPSKPDWAEGWRDRWTPGEAGAQARLRAFVSEKLADYPTERDRLATAGSSHLSPSLRFGELSSRQVLAAVRKAKGKAAEGATKFIAELLWRDFDYHVLFHHPDLAEKNLHDKFDRMPWHKVSKPTLAAWQQGQTGFPAVDAGMRELWRTGYMHNRVRMITASFLIKDLLYDWRIGEGWFWDCLVDADPANNTMNWQWVAGSGADASPFFRVFNPVSQGKKFDPDGEYIRQWVPELANLSNKSIHEPWKAKDQELKDAGVELGTNYPKPILDHGKKRKEALKAFEKVKGH